jgi:uncharacterized membrane protein
VGRAKFWVHEPEARSDSGGADRVAGEKTGVTVSGLAAATGDTASSFTSAMEHVAQGFEALGAAILVVGVVWSLVLAVVAWRRASNAMRGYQALRRAFGATLLLGLEVLVAADLIRTVAVAPTVTNVLVLGLIVLIRTFLSFSLETEIDGVVPWRRAMTSGASQLAKASSAALRPPE